MKNTEIQVRSICAECNGTGKVEHVAWERLKQANRNWDQMTARELETWFEEAGYCGLHERIPPKEMDCPECDGGKVYNWVPVELITKELIS